MEVPIPPKVAAALVAAALTIIEDIRSGQWVNFDEVDEIANAIDSFNMVTLAAPFPQPEKRRAPSRQQQSNLPDHEDLLICLN